MALNNISIKCNGPVSSELNTFKRASVIFDVRDYRPIVLHPARTQTFFTCLFNVHKRLRTLKHSIKVFNEHLVDVCKDSSECEKHLCLARIVYIIFLKYS